MKKTILLCFIAALGVSCKPEPKNYVTLSGTITNPNEDLTLLIVKGKDYKKEIKLNDDGSFNDTLKIPEEGKYTILHNRENAVIFLKNGDETSFTLDTEEFDETLKFTGGNADKNNFVISNYLLNESIMDKSAQKSMETFKAKYTEYQRKYENLKNNYSLDTTFINEQDAEVNAMEERYITFIQEKIDLVEAFKGKPSPQFNDFENFKGGSSSLSDFKGKFVYIDVWATWCGPCKIEIPHLKKIEEMYTDKNIEFISISVDEVNEKNIWKKMVEEENLGGVQLFADNSWESKFVEEFKIKGIPRFILINPEGNVVTPDAPRPSDEELVELLNSELKNQKAPEVY